MNKVSEYSVYAYVSQSLVELLGERRESQYQSTRLDVGSAKLTTRPDFLPYWSVLQDLWYLHWSFHSKEVWLFENGVMLHRHYSGQIALVSEQDIAHEIYLLLRTVGQELVKLKPVTSLAARLSKAGVETQADFLNWIHKEQG